MPSKENGRPVVTTDSFQLVTKAVNLGHEKRIPDAKLPSEEFSHDDCQVRSAACIVLGIVCKASSVNLSSTERCIESLADRAGCQNMGLSMLSLF